MGREKAGKPRKSRTGHGGIKADVLDVLEHFPMDVSRALEEPEKTAMVMLRVGLDPAVMALRRVYKNAGRTGYYEAAFDKGLTVEQAERLEGLLLFLKKLSESTARLRQENPDGP